jgi:Putative peptidoglycan binding domain
MARDAERGQDADDWFAGDDDDAPPHRAAVSDQNASAPGTSEDWLDEAEMPARAGGGPWPTSTKLAVAGVVLVAALVLGLLLGGVFEPDKPAATTPITTSPATTTRAATTTATTPATPAAVPVPTEQLAFGDRGAEVSKLQRALTRAGYPVAVDGVYGDDTKTAVKDLQADADLPQDGIAGPQTLAALRAKLAGA